MIEQILPGVVTASEIRHDLPDAFLYPEEARLIEKAVSKRQLEFTTARWCARSALARLGHPAVPILPDPHGAPGWPESVLGSITHCAGYRAAAVAHSSDVVMLGIDAEPNAPLPEGVLESISLPGERERMHKLRDVEPEVHWGRLLFSTKEAVYKSWYPFTGQRLEFEDAEITFDTENRSFTARLRSPYRHRPSGRTISLLEGRWLAEGDLLLSGIAVPAG